MFKTKDYKCCLSSISHSSSTCFKIPIVCPHCSCSLQPIIKDNHRLSFDSDNLLVISYVGNCCNKPFYASYRYNTSNGNTTLLDIYPHLKPLVLPQKIQDLSSRFVDLYNQSYTAEQNGHLELAGSGYRNAMEVLIKDFAINKLNKDPKKVCKESLYDTIGNYLTQINLSTAGDVVRVLGNDYTHYERKYDDIDFVVLKRYLEIIIQQIDTNLLLMEPIIEVERKD